MWYTAYYDSPVGKLLLASDGDDLTGLWLEGQKYYAGTIAGDRAERGDLPVFLATKNWLDRYFSGGKPAVSELPLRPEGSDFRREVWKILCGIPYGEVVSYGEIAKEMAARLGRESMAGQAVGGAVGHNPISIIIPCHRVVGAGGSLTGYAGGIGKKIELLKREGVDVSHFSIPTKGTAL